MRQAPRLFVLWSTVVWAIALLFSTQIADGMQAAWQPTGGGQYARVLLPLFVATFVSIAVPRGIAIAVLGALLRGRVSAGRWIATSIGGVVAGALCIAVVSIGIGGALLEGSIAFAYGDASLSIRVIMLTSWVVGEMAFGIALGAAQAAALSAEGHPRTGRLIVASLVGWGAYALVGRAFLLVYDGANLPLELIAALLLTANLIPGLVTGRALQRILEVPAGETEEIPGVPETAGPVY